MRIDSMTKSYMVRGVLLTLLLLSASGRAIAVREDSQQLTHVLGEARDEAAELARDADEAESLIRNQVSWETHAAVLDRVKDHVNNMAHLPPPAMSRCIAHSALWTSALMLRYAVLSRSRGDNVASIDH
jgi:hypothetical protein